MKKYQLTMNGTTPLLLHKDNYKWSERVKAWSKDPKNTAKVIPGDDRTPAWVWIGCCYFANKLLVMDSDNIMAMFRDAGKKCPSGKGKATLKAQTQSDILVNEIGWPIIVNGKQIEQSVIESLKDEENFEKHELLAIENDFELFVKRAKVGASKHLRVRPRFDQWSITGTITLLNNDLEKHLSNLLEQAGTKVGIGDWRPGGSTPGQFGMFEATYQEV